MDRIIGKLIIVFFMVMLATFVIVKFGISGGGLPLSKVKKLGKVPVYEGNRNLIKEMPGKGDFESPKDKAMESCLYEFLESLKLSMTQLCDFIDEGEMEMSYWNGMHSSGLYEEREKYRIIFKSEKGEFKQCEHRVYQDKRKKTEIHKKGYEVVFYDEAEYVKSYRLRGGSERVYFYLNNKIKKYRYKLNDNLQYSIDWDGEGKIITEEVKEYSR